MTESDDDNEDGVITVMDVVVDDHEGAFVRRQTFFLVVMAALRVLSLVAEVLALNPGRLKARCRVVSVPSSWNPFSSSWYKKSHRSS
jgi:hypothetical protein